MSTDSQEKLLDDNRSLDGYCDSGEDVRLRTNSKSSRWRILLLHTALAVSLLVNAAFIISKVIPGRTKAAIEGQDLSLYAKLPRDTPRQFDPYSQYGVGNKNETDRSVLWESLEVSMGSVALPYSWIEGQEGIPKSQPFPWDQEKGIYLLNGHHSLHCLRKVRRWATIAYHNGTQLDAYSHVVHCMDFLLQNILCEADDTPVYTSQTAKKDAGYGQTRQCRSWDALNHWAEENTSCYAFVNETQGVNSTFERYKYCPKDSLYAERMRRRLKLPDDWYEDAPREIESMPPYWEDFTQNEFVFHEATDI